MRSRADKFEPISKPVQGLVAQAVAASIGDPNLICHLSDLSIEDLEALVAILRVVAASAEMLKVLPANDSEACPRIEAQPGRRICIVTQFRMPGTASISDADTSVVIEDCADA